MDRLGRCAREGCEMIYVDVSRGGRQRYCSPRCANRDAVRRHRVRSRTAGSRRAGRWTEQRVGRGVNRSFRATVRFVVSVILLSSRGVTGAGSSLSRLAYVGMCGWRWAGRDWEMGTVELPEL